MTTIEKAIRWIKDAKVALYIYLIVTLKSLSSGYLFDKFI